MWVDGFWVGAQRVSRYLKVCELALCAGGWEALADCSDADLRELGVSDRLIAIWRGSTAKKTAGRAMLIVEPAYPAALRDLPDAPPVLFVEGDASVLQQTGVGIVGTRSCTSYGLAMARGLAAGAADAGRVVVSGLARGIDASAHRGTFGVGKTVAVLAHGLNHTAPSAHRSLRKELLDRGGVCVTTWSDAVPPRRWTFPLRNRWIAGLSDAVALVEVPVRSGAMHTARAALEYGRTVFVVPDRVGSAVSAGCLSLIRDGATVITSVDAFTEEVRPPSARRDWFEALVTGASLEEVARVYGGSLMELLGEIERLEAKGGLVALPGRRYAQGPVRCLP